MPPGIQHQSLTTGESAFPGDNTSKWPPQVILCHSLDVLRTTLSWVLTLPFLITFGGSLLVFDPLQRIARLFGQRPQEIVAGAMQVALVFAVKVSGARLIVERSNKVKPNRPYLLVANHQSMLDIPIVGATLFSNFPKYVAKRELAHWLPGISYNLRRGGNAIIERSDRQQATEAIREMGRQAQARGVSALIYPEGTRSRQGQVRRFKKPGTVALMESAPELPIVPVTIDGSWYLLVNRLLPVPFRTTVRLHVGDPIERSPNEDLNAIIVECQERIEKVLAGWRNA
ncbi:MAG: lysophospholipid acyltransferase family protein [Myxococcota bacterium]|nr:lysophospholipid acyltransferase family protein [Myxococcota bacterium]